MGTDFCLINFFNIVVLNVMFAQIMIEYHHHKIYLSDPKSYVKKCGHQISNKEIVISKQKFLFYFS